MPSETVRARADIFTLGGTTLESKAVPRASLQTAYNFATEFIVKLTQADDDLNQALIAAGLTDQKELRLVRDYLQSALRPKRLGGRSAEGMKQAQVVNGLLDVIRLNIQEESNDGVKHGRIRRGKEWRREVAGGHEEFDYDDND